MITGNKSQLVQILAGIIPLVNSLDNFKDNEELVVCVMRKTKYKSLASNSLFHSLLQEFWKSGCSSFNDYDTLRNHYKKQAGLIITDKISLEGITLIKETHKSWTNVTQANASIAISQLKADMFEAGVNSKKFDEIMKGLGEWQ